MKSPASEHSKLISIVVPFYNARDCLERLFISLADYAERADIEMLIVDDCSLEEHAQALDALAQQHAWPSLRVIHAARNGGAAKARKIGIEVATGKYIAFLDSDDAWALDKLYAQVAHMQNTGAVISGRACEQIDESELATRRAEPIDAYSSTHYSPLKAMFSNPFSTPTVMLRRDVALANPFSDTLRYSEDVDCWRRIVLQHGGIILREPNAFMFKHAFLNDQGSLSSFTLRMSIGQLSSLTALLFNAKIAIRFRCLVPIALLWASMKAIRREWIVLRSRA